MAELFGGKLLMVFEGEFFLKQEIHKCCCSETQDDRNEVMDLKKIGKTVEDDDISDHRNKPKETVGDELLEVFAWHI